MVIDESGSMGGKEADVIGGFKSVIDEQKANTEGTCSVSYFKFSDGVEEVYRGVDVHQVEPIEDKYHPHGMTALFDGVGTAIDKIGEWLAAMDENERPEKNLIVIMTDGGENNSREYTADRVREMIKHQEDKYNWSFVYMGSDLTDAKDARSLGINTTVFSSSSDYVNNYQIINDVATCYRCMTGSTEAKSMAMTTSLNTMAEETTAKYAADNGIAIENLQ
jgi:arylsulfatase A-like enzyme